jgi:hypothetical protein
MVEVAIKRENRNLEELSFHYSRSKPVEEAFM